MLHRAAVKLSAVENLVTMYLYLTGFDVSHNPTLYKAPSISVLKLLTGFRGNFIKVN